MPMYRSNAGFMLDARDLLPESWSGQNVSSPGIGYPTVQPLFFQCIHNLCNKIREAALDFFPCQWPPALTVSSLDMVWFLKSCLVIKRHTHCRRCEGHLPMTHLFRP